MICSAFLGPLIHIFAIAGAFAARRFNVSPSKTMREASPSLVKLSGASQ